jgi:hypothetical protein
MNDTTRSGHAAPLPLELLPNRSRLLPAHRDLGRAILDSALVRGAIWLRWSGHDGIRTLHHGAGLARGWVEKDVDGLAGWAALVDGRLVVSRDRDGGTGPVLHAEAWEAGATLHAALAQHPAHPDDDQSTDEDESEGPEDGLLGATRTRIRRQAAGLTVAAIDQALADAHHGLRAAGRYADAGDESAPPTPRSSTRSGSASAPRPPPPATRPTTRTTTSACATPGPLPATGATSPTALAMPPTTPGSGPTPRTAGSPGRRATRSTPPSPAPASTP